MTDFLRLVNLVQSANAIIAEIVIWRFVLHLDIKAQLAQFFILVIGLQLSQSCAPLCGDATARCNLYSFQWLYVHEL